MFNNYGFVEPSWKLSFDFKYTSFNDFGNSELFSITNLVKFGISGGNLLYNTDLSVMIGASASQEVQPDTLYNNEVSVWRNAETNEYIYTWKINGSVIKQHNTSEFVEFYNDVLLTSMDDGISYSDHLTFENFKFEVQPTG